MICKTKEGGLRTRDRVLHYRDRHPTATVRDIQEALNISSPSVVHHHLKHSSRRVTLEEALRKARTPFASTLSHDEALARLREINRMTYAVLGDGRQS